ncbi:universal stress protein [Candidatus Viridilinea mediisalina]|uniref:Universal stress protein UspA n=1 Tax=Candidatus Viridilinea mediisalina TaxID=2024553 RepID=A0A2A6RLK9_9CHLR|nr:universal stress protein [Candidatus Viridilinea mediisalina]PDW03815.1 universal stress protein UspA [Candidatus Viridilinea mediisalina]
MYRHILVPLDGSKLAEQVLPHVHALAANEGTSKITLIRAVPPVFNTSVDYSGMLATTAADAIESLEDEAREYLDQIASTFRAEGYSVQIEISAMPAAEAVLDYAESQRADLIAIATHGRSGISRWVFGSVTQKVVQNSPVPVLVIRPHDIPEERGRRR